jgi:hypothetical protein
MDVDRRDVGVHRARRGWGSRYCRSARVDERFLGQRHADPHHDAARSWLPAVFALVTLPTSHTLTQRGTRISPGTGSALRWQSL